MSALTRNGKWICSNKVKVKFITFKLLKESKLSFDKNGFYFILFVKAESARNNKNLKIATNLNSVITKKNYFCLQNVRIFYKNQHLRILCNWNRTQNIFFRISLSYHGNDIL